MEFLRGKYGRWAALCVIILGLLLCPAAGSAQAQSDPDTFKYDYQLKKPKLTLDQLKEKAAAGDAVAQYELGLCYLTGEGAPQHYGKAAEWLRRAADQGNVAAQFRLGQMREKGLGGEQDLIKAHKWYNLAASAGSSEATLARNRLTERMRPADVEKAQNLAEDWKPVKESPGGAPAK